MRVPSYELSNADEAIDLSVVLQVTDVDKELDSILQMLRSRSNCKEQAIEIILHAQRLDASSASTKQLIDALDPKDSIVIANGMSTTETSNLAKGQHTLVLQSPKAFTCTALARSAQPQDLSAIQRSDIQLSFLVQFWGKKTGSLLSVIVLHFT
jgi:hypothetical protein